MNGDFWTYLSWAVLAILAIALLRYQYRIDCLEHDLKWARREIDDLASEVALHGQRLHFLLRHAGCTFVPKSDPHWVTGPDGKRL